MAHYVKIERADSSLIAEVSIDDPEPGVVLGPRHQLPDAIRAHIKTGETYRSLLGMYAHRVDFGADFDFRNCDLRNATLYGAKLVGARFECADLSYADFGLADLRGADCSKAGHVNGADFRHANLRGADLGQNGLTGCRFGHAQLDGAKYRGSVLRRHIASVDRSDDYTFHAFEVRGGGVMIAAGCRWLTIPEYRRHNTAAYKGLRIGDETTAILDFLEARARHLGIDVSKPTDARIDADAIPL